MAGGSARHRRSPSPWSRRGPVLLDGLLLTGVVTAATYVVASQLIQTLLLLLASLGTMITIAIGVRINRVADLQPWRLVLIGLALLSVVNAIWFVTVGLGDAASADGPVARSFHGAGYVALLAAAVLVVVRHAPEDGGGVIDAALVGIGVAAPVWEFLLRPHLRRADLALSGQATLLIQVLALMAILGSLLRISRTTGRGQAALNYLFAAIATTVAGLVLSVVSADDTGAAPPYVGVFWLWGYLCLAAAALHPSVQYFTVPAGWQRGRVATLRLGYLGVFLLLNPIIGGLPQLFGVPPDGLLLCMGQLLVIPLVLTRIGQMTRQRERDRRRLLHQATHCDLTGLANRRHLFDLIAEAVRRHAEDAGPAVALLFCDLNDFKPVNDLWGHEAGDHVLRVMAKRLTSSVRPGDVVGRIGGDEFLVMCPGLTPDEAERLRDRVAAAMAEPIDWQGRRLTLGAAIGIAITTAGVDLSSDALVAAADHEMYQNKRAHKATLRPIG